MKKNIIRIMTFALLLVTMFTLASCSFKTPTVDESKATLEAAGYTVEVMDGAAYCESEKNTFNLTSGELDKYLYAKKGDDEIYMFYFFSSSQAEFNSSFINYPGLLSGQSNEMIYYATKQARKDANL